jgi:hypothetical protein
MAANSVLQLTTWSSSAFSGSVFFEVCISVFITHVVP